MKGLKEFLELLKEDKGLMAEIEKVKDDTAKIVEIAKNRGYEFSEQEYDDFKMEAVSGGGIKEKIIDRAIDLVFNDPEKAKELCEAYGVDFNSILKKAGLA